MNRRRRANALPARIAALSAAQAIGRLRELSRLRRRCPLQSPAKARDCSPDCRERFAIPRSGNSARGQQRHVPLVAMLSQQRAARAQADEIKALNGIIVGAETLGSDLMRARMVLQGKSNAIRNLIFWARLCRRSPPGSCSRWQCSLPVDALLTAARLLPAVLARTTRPLRSFRLSLLRQSRWSLANH